jgi:ribosomal protein L24E
MEKTRSCIILAGSFFFASCIKCNFRNQGDLTKLGSGIYYVKQNKKMYFFAENKKLWAELNNLKLNCLYLIYNMFLNMPTSLFFGCSKFDLIFKK